MSENVFCAGQKINNQHVRDGWFRTFRGYPEMNEGIKRMLQIYAKKGQFAKILVFFSCKCEFDNDYSEFLTREVARGFL